MIIYLRKNALPIFIEIIFVVSCFFVPQEYYIYTNLLFYLLLFAHFYVKREFSFREWGKNLKSGKTFWKQVIVTTVFFLIVFGLTTALELFPLFRHGNDYAEKGYAGAFDCFCNFYDVSSCNHRRKFLP